jgi:hypothetical protein
VLSVPLMSKERCDLCQDDYSVGSLDGGREASLRRLKQHRSALTNDNARCHCIPGCHARKDRCICNANSTQSVDLEAAVHHRHVIAPHLCGARLMPEGSQIITEELDQLASGESPRQ